MGDKEPRRRKKNNRKDFPRREEIQFEDLMGLKTEGKDSDELEEEDYSPPAPPHEPSKAAQVVFMLLFFTLVGVISSVFITLHQQTDSEGHASLFGDDLSIFSSGLHHDGERESERLSHMDADQSNENGDDSLKIPEQPFDESDETSDELSDHAEHEEQEEHEEEQPGIMDYQAFFGRFFSSEDSLTEDTEGDGPASNVNVDDKNLAAHDEIVPLDEPEIEGTLSVEEELIENEPVYHSEEHSEPNFPTAEFHEAEDDGEEDDHPQDTNDQPGMKCDNDVDDEYDEIIPPVSDSFENSIAFDEELEEQFKYDLDSSDTADSGITDDMPEAVEEIKRISEKDASTDDYELEEEFDFWQF